MNVFKTALLGGLASLALMYAPAAFAAGADQGALIHPVTKPLTVVFIPKVIHPWY